ncbi:protein tyrosine phosphatase receptor type C-associated protein [Anomaloglossus baeobatrachus]|uniref:protein tyrosine phosphatase receptor type C-associated protein n=1 Tax=Anomaloglossus baeobatrachus TaxID=238106 RepID=UPI003F4FCCDE
MENRIRALATLLVGSWLSLLPVTQASPSDDSSGSTMTVVLLIILLIVLCVALVLAWKKLIHTEGGEDYHPQELWGRAQEFMQNTKTRWTQGEQEEEDSTVEDNQDEDVELKDEEPDITAL